MGILIPRMRATASSVVFHPWCTPAMDYLQVPSCSNSLAALNVRRTSAQTAPSQRECNTNPPKVPSYEDVVKVVDKEFHKCCGASPTTPMPTDDHVPMSIVIVQQNEAIKFGPAEQRLHCPHCRKLMLSVVEAQTTNKTHLVALLMCVLGGCCFAPLPYAMDTCKTLNHYCSQCGQHLGKYDM